MARILSLLEEAGLNGLPMHTDDSHIFHMHPIYAAFSGDYPKQVLMTGTKTRQSVTSQVPSDMIGKEHEDYPLCDMASTLRILQLADLFPPEFN